MKLPLTEKWARYYARIENSCIYFCKSIETNDFAACYVIYNCTIDTMRMRLPEWDNKEHLTLIIKHEFDTEWLLLIFEEFEKQFFDKRKQLLAKSLVYSKECMDKPDQTNRYAFGKVHVRITGIDNIPNIGKLFFKIRLGPFFIESRRLKGPTKENKYKVN